MIRYDRSQEAIERRKKTHKCSGMCYDSDTLPCCLEVTICEETANREFLFNILVPLFIGIVLLAGLLGGLRLIYYVIERIIEII